MMSMIALGAVAVPLSTTVTRTTTVIDSGSHAGAGPKPSLPPPIPAAKYIPSYPDYSNHYFIGHYHAPDTDTLASAIGAALFFGGHAVLPCNQISKEMLYVMDRFSVSPPQRVNASHTPLVLVDFNTASQLDPIAKNAQIDGIIDHHELINVVPLGKPAYVLEQPWGSCATIIASMFRQGGGKSALTPSVAGLLLSAIISDTLNFKSPTSTRNDHDMASYLNESAGGLDTEALASAMFRAKANLSDFTSYEIITSDFKEFLETESSCGKKYNVGWGAVETVEPYYSNYSSSNYPLLHSLVDAMKELKASHKLDLLFVGIVEMEKGRSCILAPFPEEHELARQMFPDGESCGLISGSSVAWNATPAVSRKKDFIPALKGALDSQCAEA